jgi:ABC-type phosphate transport system substrate-binding protein
MVERSRRRRGMYDITKTRMLLTMAVFAAVAALCAGGANARIPAESGSASAAQESLRIGAYAAQPPSWRGKGGKGEETGGATNPLQQTGLARRDHQLDTAIGTAMAARAAETAQASNGIAVEAAELTRPCSPQESRTAC